MFGEQTTNNNLLVPLDHMDDQQRVHFEDACADVSSESCQGFMRHSRRFFQRCLDREDIAVDVDEALWPDRNQRHDGGGV